MINKEKPMREELDRLIEFIIKDLHYKSPEQHDGVLRAYLKRFAIDVLEAVDRTDVLYSTIEGWQRTHAAVMPKGFKPDLLESESVEEPEYNPDADEHGYCGGE